ncbi:polysaccharide biosynthesis tyrosine autokinase [Rudanella paleaurantiibacter]|uniref:non-specific protein-tyrosine kinase n=1 Tax=Rudanella paleaurantiibacter TaxID=2614655 RepID=A0A7J5U4L6_9BACT|nr:tyrosine-protein kinase [Rudanella paleaurantiibacter]KAB7732643.1 polysaccharide biosynthesis tyrosine autokinase [Rudanella paleaurantiibacter]
MNNDSTYSYVPYQMVEGESKNLRAVLMRYARNWPWFVASMAIALAAAYVYLLYQQPVYKVQASLLIKDEKKGLDQSSVLKELEIFTPKKVVDNEIEILKSYTLMDKIVSRLQLTTRYYKPTRFGYREVYEAPFRLIVEKPTPQLYESELNFAFLSDQTVDINGKVYPLNESVQTPYGRLRVFNRKPVGVNTEPVRVQVVTQTEAVTDFLKKLKAEPTSKASSVIMLTLEDAVPHRGEAMLNELIEEYNQAAIADKNKMAANTLRFIEERLALISSELASVEKDVERYKSNQGITDLGAQAQNFLATVQQNDVQMNQVKIQMSALNDLDRYLKSQSSSQGLAPATLGLADPVLLGMVNRLSELELKREQAVRTTSELNPIVQTLDGQIKETRTNITENVETMKKQLASTQQQLMANNGRMESMIRTIPAKERSLLDITRQQSIKNGLYTYLLQKREETAVSFASTISDSRTIDAARAGNLPIKPVRRFFFLVFGLLGLLLPIGVIAGRDALNNRVLRRADVEDQTQAPILGELVKNKNGEAMVIRSRSQSVLAEQIRTLRTNLQFLRTDAERSQVLLFTSSISGEGKSFISLNLGASLALTGRRTVVLEMDLRKPKLHKNLGIAHGSGISNYLIGDATVEEILRQVPGHDNYFIITSGPIPPNPAELLSTPKLTELINALKEHFDYVLIDSPPIGLVTDAQLIAPLADATLYVVRHDLTPKLYLKQLDTWYREQRFQKLNVILNAVGDGEAYYNSYGYGGYYDEKKPARTGKRA